MDLRQFLPKEGDTWSLTSENYDDLLQLLQKLSKATVDPNYRHAIYVISLFSLLTKRKILRRKVKFGRRGPQGC